MDLLFKVLDLIFIFLPNGIHCPLSPAHVQSHNLMAAEAKSLSFIYLFAVADRVGVVQITKLLISVRRRGPAQKLLSIWIIS